MPYMNPFEKRGLERGREQGREQGREEGAREGACKILTVQLEKRFGSLTPPTVERLNQARTEELMRWSAAVLDAASIDQVFSLR